MPYNLRKKSEASPDVKKRQANGSSTSASPSKKVKSNVTTHADESNEVSTESVSSPSPSKVNGTKSATKKGGIKKKSTGTTKSIEKLRKGVVLELQTLSPSKPSDAGAKVKVGATKKAVLTDINVKGAKKSVIDSIAGLGKGQPIKRIAKTHVKKGLAVKTPKSIKKTTRKLKSAKTTVKQEESLKKAIVSELKRVGQVKPSIARAKHMLDDAKKSVNTEIVKNAVVRQIKKLGKTDGGIKLKHVPQKDVKPVA